PLSPPSTLFPYTTLFRSAEGDLEHGRRVLQREPHVAEHLHGHRPVQHCPAAQERQHRAEGDAGAQRVAIAAELIAQARVDQLSRDRKSTRLNSSHGSISY